MMSERERIARLIRMHSYDREFGTCWCCVLAVTTSGNDITRMSFVEHSLHLADRIQWRRHRSVADSISKGANA